VPDVLFEPERHEPLVERPWSEGVARQAIEAIVRDALREFAPERLWPVHPRDTGRPVAALKPLYFGAAGVIWALEWLRAIGATELRGDFSGCVARLLEANRREIPGQGGTQASLLLGDAGILLAHYRLAPSTALADALAGVIASNHENPVLELMWGAPGTMLAALALHAWTGEERFAELYRASAAALRQALAFDAELRCALWTQNLYGQRARLLGAVHGFAGNAFALIRGRALLDPAEWDDWSRWICDAIRATAMRDGPRANWPQSIGAARPGRTSPLVQHCHGAPGIVTCVAGLLEPRLDDLLWAGGELVWTAGPLANGAGLCHGTAGNGYAFLKLFRRTGNALWLERARAFAMHAIGQAERDLAQYGRRQHSLWTGDPGLALYLWSCIRGDDAFPTLDVF
jgi:hypothetical protein